MKKPKILDKARDAGIGVLRTYGDIIMRSGMGGRFPRFAHYARRFTPMILVGAVAWSYIPVHGNPMWWRAASVVFVWAMVYALWSGLAHTARLCEYCIREFPVNGSELAAARRGRLRMYHRHGNKWLIIPIVCELAINYTGPHVGLRGMPLVAAWTPFGLAYAWALYRYHLTHDRLQAWCPYCRHNRPPEDAPEPTPDPSQNRPVPA